MADITPAHQHITSYIPPPYFPSLLPLLIHSSLPSLLPLLTPPSPPLPPLTPPLAPPSLPLHLPSLLPPSPPSCHTFLLSHFVPSLLPLLTPHSSPHISLPLLLLPLPLQISCLVCLRGLKRSQVAVLQFSSWVDGVHLCGGDAHCFVARFVLGAEPQNTCKCHYMGTRKSQQMCVVLTVDLFPNPA